MTDVPAWVVVGGTFVGPVGVLLGFALSELSSSLRGRAERERARDGEEEVRVLDYLTVLESVVDGVSTGIHTLITDGAGGNIPSQDLADGRAALNDDIRALQRATMALRVLGPEWLAEPAAPIYDRSVPGLLEKMTHFQRSTERNHVRMTNSLHALVDESRELVDLAQRRLSVGKDRRYSRFRRG